MTTSTTTTTTRRGRRRCDAGEGTSKSGRCSSPTRRQSTSRRRKTSLPAEARFREASGRPPDPDESGLGFDPGPVRRKPGFPRCRVGNVSETEKEKNKNC